MPDSFDITPFCSPAFYREFSQNVKKARNRQVAVAATRAGTTVQAFRAAGVEYRNRMVAELLMTGHVTIPRVGSLRIVSIKGQQRVLFRATGAFKRFFQSADIPLSFVKKRKERKVTSRPPQRGMSVRERYK